MCDLSINLSVVGTTSQYSCNNWHVYNLDSPQIFTATPLLQPLLTKNDIITEGSMWASKRCWASELGISPIEGTVQLPAYIMYTIQGCLQRMMQFRKFYIKCDSLHPELLLYSFPAPFEYTDHGNRFIMGVSIGVGYSSICTCW
jgi:hypothetical protein